MSTDLCCFGWTIDPQFAHVNTIHAHRQVTSNWTWKWKRLANRTSKIWVH